MYKEKHRIAQGLVDRESSWKFPIVVPLLFKVAGGTTQWVSLLHLPIGRNDFRNPDPYPDALTAASGARVVGSGGAPLGVLYRVEVAHIKSDGTVFQAAAGTTVQIKSVSSSGATGGAVTALTGVFDLHAATNFRDNIPITAPTERQLPFGANGAASALVAALFTGDNLVAEIVSTGAEDFTAAAVAMILDVS